MMGLNTSAELTCVNDDAFPPAIKTPEIKHNNVTPLTVSQGDNCNFLSHQLAIFLKSVFVSNAENANFSRDLSQK